jgi:hypothetical protein
MSGRFSGKLLNFKSLSGFVCKVLIEHNNRVMDGNESIGAE